MRPAVLVAIAAIFFIPLVHLPEDADAHGVHSGGGYFVRVDNEQYSDQTIDTDGALVISGTLNNRLARHEIVLTPYVSADSNHFLPFNTYNFHYYYPLLGDTASWYFRIEHSLTNPVVLGPGEEVDYEIRAYPLKAGTYHIHSFFILDGRPPFPGAELVARGATVTVTGSTAPTIGEITQLYLPLAIGAAAMPILVLRARKISRELGLGRIRKGIRIYFAAKFSLEAVWLSGLLFWLAFTAYPVTHPFETRLAAATGTTAIIAFLTIGSYFAATTKSRFQNAVAIGTAGASSLFYFLLIPGYMFLTPDVPFTFGLEYGGFGYNRNPFDLSDTVLFATVIVNAAAAILALIKKEKRKTSRFASKVVSQ